MIPSYLAPRTEADIHFYYHHPNRIHNSPLWGGGGYFAIVMGRPFIGSQMVWGWGLSRRATVSYHEGMELAPVLDQPDASPVPAGRFSRGGFCLALGVGPVVGLIWAWVAEEAQSYAAPFILFPILVGVFAGLTIVGLARFTQIGHRPTIVLSVVLAAAAAVAGQHYFRYVSDYSSVKGDSPIFTDTKIDTDTKIGTVPGQDLSALARKLAPSFGEYLRAQADRGRPLLGQYVAKGWAAWLTWAIDAMLTLAAAVAVTIPAFRVPYCNRCRTWYRTVRNGKIDALTARRLAETCGVDEIAGLRSPRYRLSCCHAGCGPTYCELSWEEPNGAVDLVRVWLDAEKRNQIAAILDELSEKTTL